jgi:hypothetical protein
MYKYKTVNRPAGFETQPDRLNQTCGTFRSI